MILRPAEYSDIGFVTECYADWPDSTRGPVMQTDVRSWIRRSKHREGYEAIIADDPGPVGFVWMSWDPMEVWELVVHPDYRGQGRGLEMARELQAEMRERGIDEAKFLALPGKIAGKVGEIYEQTGESVGQCTGLPLKHARATQRTIL